jgi:hypothetical protein
MLHPNKYCAIIIACFPDRFRKSVKNRNIAESAKKLSVVPGIEPAISPRNHAIGVG